MLRTATGSSAPPSGEPTHKGGDDMQPRSVRKELETRRRVLSGKILSTMESTRGQENGREIFKDPYGNAALTLDGEIAVSMVERRAEMLEQVDSALADIDAG